MKKLLILTGGGDCPGLNAVIRAIVRRAHTEGGWECYGSIEAFNGLMRDPLEIVKLGLEEVSGIHFKGGTILRTTNKGNPFAFPITNEDGSIRMVDHSHRVIDRVKELGFDAVVNIGGDGSQRLSQQLFEMGLPIVGVPKTIDNDLSATEMTFGFQTAVEIATEAVDKLVTTAESHNRIMILEVMGRDAGWIALNAAVAGGAEVCLIPEIPYDIKSVMKRINGRYKNGRGFANIVIAEGAKPLEGTVTSQAADEKGYGNVRLGGVGYQLAEQMKAEGCEHVMRVTVLGHVQRGGVPIAFDRVLATQFGVKAFELVRDRQYGRMVTYMGSDIKDVTIKEAIKDYNYVQLDSYLMHTAKGIGICMGD